LALMCIAVLVSCACNRDEKREPAVGDTWTEIDLIEPAWWRQYRWTVVSTNQARDGMKVWLLRPEPALDGSYVDVSVGVIRVPLENQLARATWISRGWVARSKKVDLVIATAPGYPDPPVFAISERFADAEGGLGVSEYVFRLEGDKLRLLDELVTVDASEQTAASYDSGFVPGPSLTFRTEHDGRVDTFVFDPATGRFTYRQGLR
jgi:hypothetical protein